MDRKIKNFKINTNHNNIDVCCHQGRLELRSGDGAIQSAIDLENPHQLGLKNLEYLMAVLLFIRDPQRILVLGTAAGSLLHFIRHHYPLSAVTTVDIDTELVEQLRSMKILPPAEDRLNYVYDDAVQFIKGCNQTYDLILIDIFSGSRSPAWLLEKENIDNLHRLLSQHGALAYNLLISSEHDFKRFYRNLRLVFDGQTLCLPVNGFENTIAYAVHTPGPVRDMAMNMSRATSLSDKLGMDLMQVLSVIYNTNPTGHGII